MIGKLKDFLRKLKRRIFPGPYVELAYLAALYGDAEPGGSEVLMLGDSVALRVSKRDHDWRKLGEMVGEMVGEMTAELEKPIEMSWVAHSAYHIDVYRAMLKALAVMPSRPELVIIPLNLRSLSPQWFLEPYWQFNDEIAALESYAAHPRKGIPPLYEKRIEDVPKAAREKYLNTQVEYPFTEFKSVREFVALIESEPESDDDKFFRKQQIFVYHYMHRLTEDHPRLRSWMALPEELERLGMRALIYITPINFEGGRRFVREGFISRLEENLAVLHNTMTPLSNDRIKFCDWSRLLESKHFFDQDLATEHLAESGRLQLAKKIKYEVAEFLTR